MTSVETMDPTVKAAEIPNSAELFPREQIAKAVRVSLIALGILAIPGAIPVAAVTGAVWLANRVRKQIMK